MPPLADPDDLGQQTRVVPLAADVIDRLPQLGSRAAYFKQAIRDKLIEHKEFIAQHGDDMPEIEIVLDEDGGATVEIGEEDDNEVDFYANLAEVVDDDTLSKIAIDLSAFFEADKSSRSDWEQTYAKGLELLGMRFEERTKPFRGAAAATGSGGRAR